MAAYTHLKGVTLRRKRNNLAQDPVGSAKSNGTNEEREDEYQDKLIATLFV